MGEANKRGTIEQRIAEGIKKRTETELQRKRKRKQRWDGLTPEQKWVEMQYSWLFGLMGVDLNRR